MQYINQNTLCLTYDEYLGLFGLETYKSDLKRGLITKHGLGGNGRNILIEFETLPEKRKATIRQKYGNPYDYMAKQPIMDLIDWDAVAFDYYNSYVLPNGSKLPNTDTDGRGKPQINYVDRYTQSVNWLNMLQKFTSDKRALKNALNISVMEFWDIVGELILKQNIAIPANPKRLKQKLKEYIAITTDVERYESLIEKHRFGNVNAKATDEVGEALIFKLLADPRQHDDTVIAAAYNKYAKENDKKTISAAAVGYMRRKHANILMATRNGAKGAYNKYSKEIGRKRASAPLLLINSDDNNLDLFFSITSRDANGRQVKNNFYRPVLYVVIDTYNDYILGYAYGNNSTKELIYEAFRSATNHIKELTGGYYLAHQLQTDRWGVDVQLKGELAEFYRKVGGKFTPQANGVPQGKYIERSFGAEWHQVLKAMPYGNYAGHNIKAKENLNPEFVAKNAKNHPDISEMPRIIAEFINVMRIKANPKTGVSRQAEWLEAFRNSEKSQKRAIDTATKLTIMGVQREGVPLTINSKGVIGTIAGQKLRFDLPDEVIWKHNGTKVQVLYDPADLSEVLMTNSKELRFLAREYNYMPSALADFEDGDGKRLQEAFDAKKQISERLTSVLNSKLEALDGLNINAESLLQAGVMLKDLKNGAEADYMQQLYGAKKELPAPKPAEIPKKVPTHGADNDNDSTEIYDLY